MVKFLHQKMGISFLETGQSDRVLVAPVEIGLIFEPSQAVDQARLLELLLLPILPIFFFSQHKHADATQTK